MSLSRAMATRRRPGQSGLGLIELLVGLVLGLLVIGVALGALMASRGASGTVSDAGQMHQQASHILRTLGLQIRQAGSLRLNLAVNKAPAQAIDIADPVAFEARTADFDPARDTLQGWDAPGKGQYQLAVGYSNDMQPLHISAAEASLQRNCLGQSHSSRLVQSRFVLDSERHTLRCAGRPGTPAQPIAENIANFQLRYLLQEPGGSGHIQYASAQGVGDGWQRVFGVEVCLVLFGTEAIDMPAGSRYTDCADSQGQAAAIDMSTLPAPRTRRPHMVFRSTFQLRSQGAAH